jgi:beta-fructofuranosidase
VSIFYRPDGATAADFIPFFWNGTYHLFYLKDYRDVGKHGEGTPWWQVATRDFVNFDDFGESLARSAMQEQDLYVFTGGVIEHEGTFHIFYTGHNPHFRENGKPEQGVMHAVSDDLVHWRKVPEDTFYAPAADYEMHDWRDPFLFWNEEAQEFWMLLAARKKEGPSRLRGVTALCASSDLKHWEVRAPFWDPGLYYTHECPDLFRMGDWWYLVFSEFSERFRTRYRMSRSLDGPWLCPSDDLFDDRAYYAAKTAGHASKRFIFGWLPTKEDDDDRKGWQWGGNLVAHELWQRADGTLCVKAPSSVLDAFNTELPHDTVPVTGSWRWEDNAIRCAAPGGLSLASLGPMPDCYRVSATLTYHDPTASFGLVFRPDWEKGNLYQLRFDPARNSVAFDFVHWPKQWDLPWFAQRPLAMAPDEAIRLDVIVDGTCVVAYINDEIALSCRMYQTPGHDLGLFVSEGDAEFNHLKVRVR